MVPFLYIKRVHCKFNIVYGTKIQSNIFNYGYGWLICYLAENNFLLDDIFCFNSVLFNVFTKGVNTF